MDGHKYKIGDICRFLLAGFNSAGGTHKYSGDDVIVVALDFNLPNSTLRLKPGFPHYTVEASDGRVFGAIEPVLELKRPGDDFSSINTITKMRGVPA